MLNKTRLLHTTNSILNNCLILFFVLCGLYFASMYFTVDSQFVELLLIIIGKGSWTIIGVSLVLIVLSLVIWFIDNEFEVRLFFWNLIRSALVYGVGFLISVSETVIRSGIEI